MRTGGFQVKIPLIAAAAAALTFTASFSQAAVINSAYTPLGANSWLVDFTVVNDGSPASFAGFTIDFPSASSLVLVASPATWDSQPFQPDANLPDDGFLDSFAISPASRLSAGQSVGGFQVSFTYTAGQVPGALPFMLYAEDYTPLFAGLTTVTAVPEPGAGILAALGLAVFGLRAARLKATRANVPMEVIA
jgi:hypothetical protein